MASRLVVSRGVPPQRAGTSTHDRVLVAKAAFGMNTASSHEFEFESGEFGVFEVMIIRNWKLVSSTTFSHYSFIIH